VIEVGEYIRTKEGKIGKIINITISDKGIKFYSIKWDIIKYRDIKTHSKNIIDLIEKGDYVNGTKVTNIDNYDNIYTIEWEYGNVYTTEIINDKFIKTILTHEQYEQNCYKESDIE
jgi:hypothetical protein